MKPTKRLYVIRYVDAHDPCCPTFRTLVRAYSEEHAEDLFFDSDDDGWRILSVSAVKP
jgi:hypothetical protein